MKKIFMLMFLTFSVFIGISSPKAYDLSNDRNNKFLINTDQGNFNVSIQDLINVDSDFISSNYIIITKSDINDSVDIFGIGRAGLSLTDDDKIQIQYKNFYSYHIKYHYNFKTNTFIKDYKNRLSGSSFFINHEVYGCIMLGHSTYTSLDFLPLYDVSKPETLKLLKFNKYPYNIKYATFVSKHVSDYYLFIKDDISYNFSPLNGGLDYDFYFNNIKENKYFLSFEDSGTSYMNLTTNDPIYVKDGYFYYSNDTRVTSGSAKDIDHFKTIFSSYNIYDESGNLFFNKNIDYVSVYDNYKLKKVYDCSKASKIVVNFKKGISSDFSFKFNAYVNSADIPKPYLEIENIYNGDTSVIQIEDFSKKIAKYEPDDVDPIYSHYYTGNFGLNLIDSGSLSFIIDVSKYDGDLLLDFTSSYDFIESYNLIEDYDQNKVVIDMSDVYGLYLMPRVAGGDLFTPIYTDGTYNLQVRHNFLGVGWLYEDDIDYDLDYSKDNYKNKYFQYLYKFRNAGPELDNNTINYLIYFQNVDYKIDSYIEFDGRFYNYAIKKNQYDTPSIIDPSSGQSYDLPADDNIVDSTENVETSTFSMIKNAFKRFSNIIFEIFDLVSYFYSTLPIVLKYFFVLLLFFIVLLLFFKLLL